MPSRRQKPPCPVELSNVALRMAPRMHQYMELENHKFKKNSGEGHCRNRTFLDQCKELNMKRRVKILQGSVVTKTVLGGL